jgi:diaminopimelate decarboxylase
MAKPWNFPTPPRLPLHKMPITNDTIRQLSRQRGTPLYLYDTALVVEKCRLLQQLVPLGVHILYSVKANPHPGICRLIQEQGLQAEIASVGEMVLARDTGFDPGACMVAGPGKNAAALAQYIEQGIGYINCESVTEAQRIHTAAVAAGRRVKVNIRLNPQFIGAGAKVKMGGKPSPFGIDEEQMEPAIRAIEALPGIELCGLHVYSGTQFLSGETIIANFEYILQLALRFAEITGKAPALINFGGGFGIPVSDNESPIDEPLLLQGLQRFFEAARRNRQFDQTRFYIESGRFITAASGIFVCSVVDIKKSRGKTFLVLDGGINNCLALSPHFRFDAKNPMVNIIPLRPGSTVAANTEPVDIVGPLCTSLDCLARKISLSLPAIDDLVVFPNTGAYALTMSPAAFLSYPVPPEILL